MSNDLTAILTHAIDTTTGRERMMFRLALKAFKDHLALTPQPPFHELTTPDITVYDDEQCDMNSDNIDHFDADRIAAMTAGVEW